MIVLRKMGCNKNKPSELDFEEEGHFHGQGAQHMEDAQSSGPSELMGQSPTLLSPTAAQFPLMFTPQRPDEMYIPSHSWLQNTTYYEDNCEEGIPTMITWSYGGKMVALEGSWDDWKIRKPLQRSGKEFTIMMVLPSGVTIMMVLPSGVYQYRFLVDGRWRTICLRTWKALLVLNLLSLQIQVITICALVQRIIQRSHHLSHHTYK